MKLTIRSIDTITPDPTKDIYVWDDKLAGFGLRVKPSGVASFMIQYRTAEGISRRLTLGKLGPLTPDEARAEARRKLAEVAKGGDPGIERREIRQAMTVADMCDWYLTEAKAGRLLGRHDRPIKASTLAVDTSRINAHVVPLLGTRKVNSLKPDDIRDFMNAVRSGRAAKARVAKAGAGRGGASTGGPGVAARCVGMLRTIFAHAMREHPDRRSIAANPCAGVKRPADGKQRRFLSLDEIVLLGKAIREAEDAGESRTGLAAIRLLLLTGLRRMEALSLPWAWVDGKGRCIRFGDTKSGAQLRPIGADAVRLLDGLPRLKGCPWVFPAARGTGHYIGLPKALERLCGMAGLEGVTVHVLRHSFAAAAAGMGFSELTIAGLLGHNVASVTARYAHVADSALISAASQVAARIAEALDGTRSDNVVPLRNPQAETGA